MNILTIDIEDWYMDLPLPTWESQEDRVVNNTNTILKILDNAQTKATFFIVGYVAEHHPELVKTIQEKGHDIGTHGYSHTSIQKQTPTEFEKDLVKSIKILEKITKQKIRGHRACQFSITEETTWALDILKKHQFHYDSSIFPVKTHLYGVPGIPTSPYHISAKDIKKNSQEEQFLEFPLSSYQLPIIRKRIPISGGFYLRALPYWFIKNTIKKINNTGTPVTCYVHPWEFDPNQPRTKELKWYHYYGLRSTESKFKKLVNDFKFTSIEEWITHA